jgi:hypothetical protein
MTQMTIRKAAGSHRNFPVGLIINQPSSVFTKYVPGSGIGATSTAVRRSKLLHATMCRHTCNTKLGLYTRGGTSISPFNYYLTL